MPCLVQVCGALYRSSYIPESVSDIGTQYRNRDVIEKGKSVHLYISDFLTHKLIKIYIMQENSRAKCTP